MNDNPSATALGNNRTFVELKQAIYTSFLQSLNSNNRTFVELKQLRQAFLASSTLA